MSKKSRRKRFRLAKKNSRKRQTNKPLKDAASTIGFRLNIFFAVIFTLFLILLGKLYFIQVLDKKFYAEKLAQFGIQTKVREEMPRGQIFDSKGQVIASTALTPSVSFTRTEKITTDNMRNIALKLVPIFKQYIDASSLTERDKKDFYLANYTNLNKIAMQIPQNKQYDKAGNKISAAALYALEVDKVTSNDINFSPNDLLAAQVFKQMNATQLYSTSDIITGEITADQQAKLGQELSSLPGISIGNSWDHNVTPGNLLGPVIGTISTTKAGLPKDEVNNYLAKGYSLNDRVGTSYLEKGYESYLQGKDSITKINVDSKGNIVHKKALQKGKRGKDLKLTVDYNFEKGVQQILQNNMDTMISEGFGDYANGAYTVVMNPSTGAILAMNGIDRNPSTGTMTDDSLGTITDAFTPGSVVKPGTLTAGWETNAISGNQLLNDQTIQIAGSQPINSWFTNGLTPITADEALEYSSNTYMVQVALRMLGQPYRANMTLSNTNRVKVYDAFRHAYGEYGLGVSTGIDIPGESIGLTPSVNSDNATVANALYEAFGQFDNYTPLQLAQYAATIANNGTRVAPHIVQGIYKSDNSDLGSLVKTIPTKALGKVGISQDQMDIIHKGMQEVVSGNPNMRTGGQIGNGAATSISAKTGTSQTYVTASDGTLVPVTVNNVVAFAPSNNPKIAIGVMVPNTTIYGNGGSTTDEVSHLITRDIVNLYNSMYGFK